MKKIPLSKLPFDKEVEVTESINFEFWDRVFYNFISGTLYFTDKEYEFKFDNPEEILEVDLNS